MTIELNYLTVPAHDKEESARLQEHMFGFSYDGTLGNFAPIEIPNQSLTLDFDDHEGFHPAHDAFKKRDWV